MELQAFIRKIEKHTEIPLPGWEAHQIMAPAYRVKYQWDDILKQNPRRASVLILLYQQGDQIRFPFFLRNEYKGVHSNQISLPGGAFEEEDQNYEGTAIRETCEELGLEKEKIRILKNLSEVYIAPSKFLVYPFIGVYQGTPEFFPDKIEVNHLMSLSLEELLNDDLVGTGQVNSFFGPFEVPAFKLDKENFIWGATGMILMEFKTYLQDLAKLA